MNGRDKRKRAKEARMRNADCGMRNENRNPAGVTVLPKANEPVYGKYCRVRKTKVDVSVCTVQSMRTPDLCEGC
jgi:hypothetical protein